MRHNLTGAKASMEFTNNQDTINCPGLIVTPLTTENIQSSQIKQTAGGKTKRKFSVKLCNFEQAFDVDPNEKIPVQITKRDTYFFKQPVCKQPALGM